jgi:hypothetical protein
MSMASEMREKANSVNSKRIRLDNILDEIKKAADRGVYVYTKDIQCEKGNVFRTMDPYVRLLKDRGFECSYDNLDCGIARLLVRWDNA